jgi:hypothetical protein
LGLVAETPPPRTRSPAPLLDLGKRLQRTLPIVLVQARWRGQGIDGAAVKSLTATGSRNRADRSAP